MTDNEIIKAWQLVDKLREAYNAYYDTSTGVPYDIDVTLRESAFLIENLLNENKSQNAEIEKLEKGSLKEAMTFNSNTIANVRAEAVKEFMERLKKRKHECGCNYRKKPVYAVTEEKIDETYKEMVGEGK